MAPSRGHGFEVQAIDGDGPPGSISTSRGTIRRAEIARLGQWADIRCVVPVPSALELFTAGGKVSDDG